MLPLQVLIAVFLLALLFGMIQVGALSIAFDKLGLSMGSAMLLLLSSIVGSTINLPLFTLDAEAPPDGRWREPPRWLYPLLPLRRDKVMIAVNVGGGLIPVCFSIYLLAHKPLPFAVVLLATAVEASICYFASRPIRGLGIGMPILIAPLSAALLAVVLLPEQSPPLAYVCGTLGVLVGADLLRLHDVRRLGSPIASIGGAGTFDGVFVTGIVAVLLA